MHSGQAGTGEYGAGAKDSNTADTGHYRGIDAYWQVWPSIGAPVETPDADTGTRLTDTLHRIVLLTSHGVAKVGNKVVTDSMINLVDSIVFDQTAKKYKAVRRVRLAQVGNERPDSVLSEAERLQVLNPAREGIDWIIAFVGLPDYTSTSTDKKNDTSTTAMLC